MYYCYYHYYYYYYCYCYCYYYRYDYYYIILVLGKRTGRCSVSERALSRGAAREDGIVYKYGSHKNCL